MKTCNLVGALLSLGLLIGCSQGPRLEHPELNPPAETALVGTYTIVEETVSGKSSTENTLASARLEILPGGAARFVDFPLFEQRPGTQGIPRKTTGAGSWLISPASTGYALVLAPDREARRIRAIIVEGGDLIFHYAPSTDGYFSKWRKLP